MTHTSTELPEALRLAENLEQTWCMKHEAEVMRRLHARVQELEAKVETGKRLLREEMERANRYAEASQAHRAPLSADEIKEPKNGEVWRVEWWNESLRMMLPSDKVLHRFNAYRNGTLQFTLKAHAHGITQEKQG